MVKVIRRSKSAHGLDYRQGDGFFLIRYRFLAFHLMKDAVNRRGLDTALVKGGVRELEPFSKVASYEYIALCSRLFDR